MGSIDSNLIVRTLNMEFVSQSPARQALASLKEKISSEILDKQRQYEALSLSARKIPNSKIQNSKTKALDQPRNSSRQLFKNSPFRDGVQTRLQDNIQSIRDVFEETFQSPRRSSKRKFSCILNENRQNFEAVDLSVDLCFRPSEENEIISSSNKKLRMSV